ncbi:retinol dehydrogenase 12 [Pseudomassariella vexata]|uniref:Retinol dehydrogenase 12 n=1 Tax=Pseudomassariella vexata TaxID=1141098 RepID=A0A1Y2DJW2_9PEZI|nr:retinol dehydrogenase 12 [Pseudomassariella vexata]ORY59538.1 retinol dehydrogenase 12 [Pseudomassariella vexata]
MSSSLQAQASFEATFRAFLRRQRTAPTPLPVNIRLTGQTAIVTGSNVGIGLAASQQLLKLGLSHLVMGVRSQVKGDAAATQLRQEFPDSVISVWILDMESYDSIHKFVEQCASLPRIDVAILNAAVMQPSYKTAAATGHELTMQVDYLSTALLSMLLLPVLKSKKIAGAPRPPVLSIVGSDLMYSANLKTKGPVLPQFDNPKSFSQIPSYSNAKLLLMFLVAKLAELVKPDDVLINMANPGMTKGTSLGHENPVLAMKLLGIAQFFLARSAEISASIYLDAALTRGDESHGSYISDWAIKPYPAIWYTEEGQELGARLLDETMEEFKLAGVSLPQIA